MFGVPGTLGAKFGGRGVGAHVCYSYPSLGPGGPGGVAPKVMSGVTIAYMGPPPPDPKIPKFGSQRPRDPKHRIPRVCFMKNRPGARSGDLNQTDVRP